MHDLLLDHHGVLKARDLIRYAALPADSEVRHRQVARRSFGVPDTPRAGLCH